MKPVGDVDDPRHPRPWWYRHRNAVAAALAFGPVLVLAVYAGIAGWERTTGNMLWVGTALLVGWIATERFNAKQHRHAKRGRLPLHSLRAAWLVQIHDEALDSAGDLKRRCRPLAKAYKEALRELEPRLVACAVALETANGDAYTAARAAEEELRDVVQQVCDQLYEVNRSGAAFRVNIPAAIPDDSLTRLRQLLNLTRTATE